MSTDVSATNISSEVSLVNMNTDVSATDTNTDLSPTDMSIDVSSTNMSTDVSSTSISTDVSATNISTDVSATNINNLPNADKMTLQKEEDLFERVDKNVPGSGYVCRVCSKVFLTPGKIKGEVMLHETCAVREKAQIPLSLSYKKDFLRLAAKLHIA